MDALLGNLGETFIATMHKLPKFCFYQNNFLERHIFMLFFFALNGASHEVCNGIFFMSMGPMGSWFSLCPPICTAS